MCDEDVAAIVMDNGSGIYSKGYVFLSRFLTNEIYFNE